MEEVILRRYRRLLEEGGPFPDLVIVDGGKGQLSAAYHAFEQLGLANLVAVGIAKREEEIFTRDARDPIRLPGRSPALQLIQRVRDEAHRFAVTFHRRARTMRDLRSELDIVRGSDRGAGARCFVASGASPTSAARPGRSCNRSLVRSWPTCW